MKTSTILSGFLLSVLMFSLIFASGLSAAASGHSQLTDKVKSAIANYYLEDFEVTDLGNGKIRLEGRVHTLYDKIRVFDIAAKVPGVKEIVNHIIVDTPTIPDDVIESNIRNQLNTTESILEPSRIKIQVNNGIVFLSGEVSFQREKEIAQTIASWQKGVLGVINNIKVLPPKIAVSDENLSAIVRDILNDQFPLEKSVKVSIKNGVATLSGTCTTLWAKEEIQKRLQRVRGIKEVINNLEVGGAEE